MNGASTMASDFDWTTETIAHLRTLWDEGYSTAEIGRCMNTSKNSVVGKAHRLNLPPRPSPIRGKGSGERPRTRARIRTGEPSLPPLHPVADSAPPLSPPPTPPQPPRPTAPADWPAAPAVTRPISGEPCCWPIGEPGTRGFRTCDAPAQPRKPYCAEHAEAAYVPVQAARGRPDGPGLDRSLRRIIRTA